MKFFKKLKLRKLTNQKGVSLERLIILIKAGTINQEQKKEKAQITENRNEEEVSLPGLQTYMVIQEYNDLMPIYPITKQIFLEKCNLAKFSQE